MGARKLASAGTSLFVAIALTIIAGGVARGQIPLPRLLAMPAAPTITEPGTEGQVVSGADVHMETAPFQDPDGNQHLCSDWEIWTVSPAERVWFTSCIGGVQKLHAHLGDGFFENSHAGRAELFPNRDYQLRVRHRDNSADAATEWSAWSVRRFHTDIQRAPLPGAPQWRVVQPGYVVEEVAGGFQLPVNIAPVPMHSSDPTKPLFYVSELYGRIRVVKGDFTVGTYASGLLNFDPTGVFPGTGETGVTGVVVEPVTGDVFASMLYASGSLHYPKVVRFHSTDGGLTASSQTTILSMPGETQGASHQISNLTIGPDGKLYVHMGDGFTPSTARDLNSFRGKILRVNLDGSAPTDNPAYNAADGITARDYVFASGFRNPFGGAWRAADGQHYSVENGPSRDRLARIYRGTDYGWDGTNASMSTNALYNWEPPHAPVNITFVESEKYHGSGFPEEKYGHAFVSESGPTYATGPQVRGKRISEFVFNADGSVSAPATLVEYDGTGKSSVVGLAAGPDGLYFTALYTDSLTAGPTAAQSKIYRVRYAPQIADEPPLVAFQDRDFKGRSQMFGTGVFEAAKGELSAVGNEAITSLRVAYGFRVVVCADDSSGGRVNTGNLGVCRYFGPGQHGFVGTDLTDRISMIAVLAGPSTGSVAIGYADANLTGTPQPMGAGAYEAIAGELQLVGATAISSLKVAGGHRTVVCQRDRSGGVNTGNLGLCRFFGPGDHATVGTDLDNAIALVAVGGPALTAYREPGYAGTAQAYGPGMWEATRGQLAVVGNDAISSLRVAAGYHLVTCGNDSYQHTNTGNLGPCRFFGPGNRTSVGSDLDNRISLLAVLPGPSSGSSLTGYQNKGFTGTNAAFGVGIHQAMYQQLGAVGNDTISSLRVATGNRAVVCQYDSSGRLNTGNLGLCRFYAAGNHTFVGADLNDRISLLAVTP